MPHDLVSREYLWNAMDFKDSVLKRATISCHDSKNNTIEIAKRIRDFGFALVKDLGSVKSELYLRPVSSSSHCIP